MNRRQLLKTAIAGGIFTGVAKVIPLEAHYVPTAPPTLPANMEIQDTRTDEEIIAEHEQYQLRMANELIDGTCGYPSGGKRAVNTWISPSLTEKILTRLNERELPVVVKEVAGRKYLILKQYDIIPLR